MLKLFFTFILANFLARLFFYYLTQRATYEWSDLWTVVLLSIPAVFLAFVLTEFVAFMGSVFWDYLKGRIYEYRYRQEREQEYTAFRWRVKMGLVKDGHFEEQAKKKVIK